MSLGIIGKHAEVVVQNSIGRPHGAIASETSPAVVRQWLVERHPERTDQALLTSLRSSLNVVVEPVTECRFPKAGGFYSVTVGCRFSGTEENYPVALAKLEAAMEPPTSDQAEEWLVLLQAATASAKRSEEGSAVSLALYAGALRRYPADVAKSACEDIATTAKWFPVLSDIIERCDRLVYNRRAMISSMRRVVDRMAAHG